MTFYEIAQWIILNRKGNAFKNYNMAKICRELMECAQQNAMLCVTDELGNIIGVYAGKRDDVAKEFFVYDVLCIRPWVLKQMLNDFIIKYPDYNIIGTRHGINRTFKAKQLTERL